MSNSSSEESKISDTINQQVSQAYQSTKQEKIENIEQITYNGKSIPLKSDRLKGAFKKVENQQDVINTQESSGDKDLIANYLKFANILDDAILVIKKDKAEESKKSEQSGQVYNYLIAYCNKLKNKASVDRNLLQARILANKLSIEHVFQSKLGSSIRPQNIIRFFEKAMKAIKA